MVVFRPFVSEVIIAKVKSSDEEGIRRAFPVSFHGPQRTLISFLPVSVNFFDDLYIPAAYLPQPTAL